MRDVRFIFSCFQEAHGTVMYGNMFCSMREMREMRERCAVSQQNVSHVVALDLTTKCFFREGMMYDHVE